MVADGQCNLFAKPPMQVSTLRKLICKFVFCHKLIKLKKWYIQNKNVDVSIFGLEKIKYVRVTHSLRMDLKRKKKANTSKKMKSESMFKFFFFIFSPYFLVSGSAGGRFLSGTERPRGHHKARVTIEEVIWTFQPKNTKRRGWLTQSGIPFQTSPCCLFVSMLCLLDNCLQPAL